MQKVLRQSTTFVDYYLIIRLLNYLWIVRWNMIFYLINSLPTKKVFKAVDTFKILESMQWKQVEHSNLLFKRNKHLHRVQMPTLCLLPAESLKIKSISFLKFRCFWRHSWSFLNIPLMILTLEQLVATEAHLLSHSHQHRAIPPLNNWKEQKKF